jgi:hypothetical protein
VQIASTYILLLMFMITNTLNAQEHSFQIALHGTLTTSAKFFSNSNDADENVRSQFLPMNNILSFGVEVRNSIEAYNVQIGLSIEYLSKTESYTVPLSSNISVPAVDGFTAVPIELSGYFFIPVGSENLRLYMGSGGGIYLGSSKFEYANASKAMIDRKTGYGIHVLSGVQIKVTPMFSFRSEIKFRNIQFETINKFTRPYVTYNGTTIMLDQSPTVSRVAADGMALNIGIVYDF